MEDKIREYLYYLEKLNMSQLTLKTYNVALQAYSIFLGKHGIECEKATMQTILDYKKNLESMEYRRNSIRTKLFIVRSFYDFLAYVGCIEGNPCPKAIIPKEEIGTVRAMEKESLDIVLAYIEEKEIYIRVLFYIMLYAGLRVGEAAELENEDIRVVRNKLLISVPAKIAKGGKSRTAPYIDSHTSKILLDHVKNNPYKKISRISRRTIQYHARQISSATGIKFTCHVLRHNYATSLLEQGVRMDVIQTALGHAKIDTTRRYAETLLHNVVDVAAKINK